MARRPSLAAVSNSSIRPPASLPPPQAGIAARNHIAPIRQGAFDYLCGLYSAINAIRLARYQYAPLSQSKARELYMAGMRFLADRRAVHRAATWGMPLKLRHDLAVHLARLASCDDFQLTVEVAQGDDWTDIRQVFDWIADSLAVGHPVLIYLLGQIGPDAPDHYSVVSAVTSTSITLFDSIGLQRVLKSSCGLDDGRYLILPEALLRITVKRDE